MADSVELSFRSHRVHLLFFGMVTPVLALGAVTDVGLLVTAIVVSVICAYFGWKATALDLSIGGPARLAELTLFSAAFVRVIQLAPLPPRVLRVLSPIWAEIWLGAHRSVGIPDGWRPIALDLPGAAFAASTAMVVAAWFALLVRLSTTVNGRRRVAASVIAVVLFFDLVALAHPLLGWTIPYNFVKPLNRLETLPLVTPLLNPNHAAALACLAPPLLIAVAVESERLVPRILALVGCSVSAAVALLTFSRSGIGVVAAELILMTAWVAVKRKSSFGVAIGLAITTASGAAAGVVGMQRLFGEVSNLNAHKLEIPKAALGLIRDFRWVGTGGGAFDSVFPAYEGTLGGTLRYTATENWPTQLAADFGIPLAFGLVVAMATVLVRSAKKALREPMRVGAFVALLGLVAHDLFDYATSFAGVAMVAVALLAIITGRESHVRRVPVEQSHPRKGHRLAFWRAAMMAGLASLALAPFWKHDLDSDTRFVASAWSAGRLRQIEPFVHASIGRHPAEPYFALAAGVAATDGSKTTGHMLRAAKLGPWRAQNHFFLGRWFAGMGRKAQAWAEYRTALVLAPEYGTAVVDDLVRFRADIDEICAATGTLGSMDYAARRLEATGNPVAAAEIDERSLAMFPSAIAALGRKIARLRVKGESNAATALVETYMTTHPDEPQVYLLRASLADGVEAEEHLERGLRRGLQDASLLIALIRLRGTRLGLGSVTRELGQLLEVLGPTGMVSGYHSVQGDVELARKAPSTALLHYQTASTTPGARDDDIEKVAVLAERLGRLYVARTAWERLVERAPAEARYRESLQRLTERLAHENAMLSTSALVGTGAAP